MKKIQFKLDQKNIQIFDYKNKTFLQIDHIRWALKGWFILHDEQLHAWGLLIWWTNNHQTLKEILLKENMLQEEDLEEFEKYFEAYHMLNKKGFNLMLDKMPMIPCLPIEMIQKD